MQKKNQLAESTVGKENAETLQFRVGKDSAARNVIQDFGHRFARAIVEKPESRHGGIENSQVIFRHAQRQSFKVLEQVVFLADGSHPVIGGNREIGAVTRLLCRGKNSANIFLVPTQALLDFLRLGAVHVEEHIHFAQIQEIKRG